METHSRGDGHSTIFIQISNSSRVPYSLESTLQPTIQFVDTRGDSNLFDTYKTVNLH